MLLVQYGQEKQQSANEMSLSLLSCFSCILFENKSEQPIYLIPFLLKSFLRNVFFTWTQTEYLIHSVSNTSVQFQLLNITHRCYHATSTSSNGFEHFFSRSPNSRFFSNGSWNKAPGTFSTSHWFPSTCVRRRFAVLIYSKVTDFHLQPVSYYHCWAGERQSF